MRKIIAVLTFTFLSIFGVAGIAQASPKPAPVTHSYQTCVRVNWAVRPVNQLLNFSVNSVIPYVYVQQEGTDVEVYNNYYGWIIGWVPSQHLSYVVLTLNGQFYNAAAHLGDYELIEVPAYDTSYTFQCPPGEFP